ncbi:MAG: YtxH domain-containing protein [Cyclobacteriaceae bacterium]
MNNTVRIFAGFLLGTVCGLAAGLLVAPTTGKQARKKIGKKSKKLAKKMAGYIGMEEKFKGTSAKRRNGKAPVEV